MIAAGIRWAAEHGGRVINLSWGHALGVRSTHEVERAIANAIAAEQWSRPGRWP
jgi:hypothetical protein